MTKIILVRHCEAQGNFERIFQGHWNGNITDNGKIQLSKLAEKMKDYPFDYLYSSPLIRAVKTAKACNIYHNKPIGIIRNLIEINGGDWEGKKWADFPALFPNESKLWTLEPHSFTAPNGESMIDVYDRISKTIDMLAKRHEGKTICIASHGCAIRNYLCYAKGWNIDKLNDVEWCDNTGISVIEYDDDFVARLIVENDNSHIPSDLSTLAKQSWWKKENRDKIIFDK